MNNVLIIEDDKEICVMIKDHLEKYNYQVFFTLTGANAIERIKELSPDLIILDLMLPFISGDELIRNIRKFSDVLMMNCTNPIIEIHDHNFMITIDFSPLLIKK